MVENFANAQGNELVAVLPLIPSAGGGGGGGGDTVNYSTQVTNKPKINNVELVGNKTLAQLGIAEVTEETQIKGWTAITPDTYEELDLTTEQNSGKKKFTIIVYIRKGQIRQAIKFELTTSELNKILNKVNKNMVCITRSCVDTTDPTKIAMLKQCMTKSRKKALISMSFLKKKA